MKIVFGFGYFIIFFISSSSNPNYDLIINHLWAVCLLWLEVTLLPVYFLVKFWSLKKVPFIWFLYFLLKVNDHNPSHIVCPDFLSLWKKEKKYSLKPVFNMRPQLVVDIWIAEFYKACWFCQTRAPDSFPSQLSTQPKIVETIKNRSG